MGKIVWSNRLNDDVIGWNWSYHPSSSLGVCGIVTKSSDAGLCTYKHPQKWWPLLLIVGLRVKGGHLLLVCLFALSLSLSVNDIYSCCSILSGYCDGTFCHFFCFTINTANDVPKATSVLPSPNTQPTGDGWQNKKRVFANEFYVWRTLPEKVSQQHTRGVWVTWGSPSEFHHDWRCRIVGMIELHKRCSHKATAPPVSFTTKEDEKVARERERERERVRWKALALHQLKRWKRETILCKTDAVESWCEREKGSPGDQCQSKHPNTQQEHHPFCVLVPCMI